MIFFQNIDILKELETVRQLANILKTNVSACKSIGHLFINQLGRIYLDMVNVYKVLSENISSAVAQHGKLKFLLINFYFFGFVLFLTYYSDECQTQKL